MVFKGLFIYVLTTGLGLWFGKYLLSYLKKKEIGQFIREDGPQSHLNKAGTPTMGGMIFIIPVIIVYWLLTGYSHAGFWLTLSMLLFGGIGYRDDSLKIGMKRSLGLTAKQKLFLQFLFAGCLVFLAFKMGLLAGTTVCFFQQDLLWELGRFYYLLAVVLIVGTVNAVNLTDGLDGLAAGSAVPVLLFYLFLAFTMKMESSLFLFILALLGGLTAFLFYNRHPAKIFMGDTGSLALGGIIAALALITKTELLLLLLGGVYMVETLSVILQVSFFKTTGRRLFKMSPLHHHFELLGWDEKKIVVWFWSIGFLLLFFSLLIY